MITVRFARRLSSLALCGALCLVGCGGEDEHRPDAAATVDAAVDGPPGLDAAGSICGGFAGATCGPTEYCDYGTNGCGATDETGVCTPRPTGCPDTLVFVPTCACDGVVYGSECDAYAAGADLNANGGCPVATGSFACGYTQCGLADAYCQRQLSDVVGEPDGYACRPLPSCPGGATCACLAGEPCGAACSGAGATGLTLSCPGG